MIKVRPGESNDEAIKRMKDQKRSGGAVWNPVEEDTKALFLSKGTGSLKNIPVKVRQVLLKKSEVQVLKANSIGYYIKIVSSYNKTRDPQTLKKLLLFVKEMRTRIRNAGLGGPNTVF